MGVGQPQRGHLCSCERSGNANCSAHSTAAFRALQRPTLWARIRRSLMDNQEGQPLNARYPFKSMQWQASVPCPSCGAPRWRACVSLTVVRAAPHYGRVTDAVVAGKALARGEPDG